MPVVCDRIEMIGSVEYIFVDELTRHAMITKVTKGWRSALRRCDLARLRQERIVVEQTAGGIYACSHGLCLLATLLELRRDQL